MRKQVIDIDRDVVATLQKLDFEVTAREHIIKTMLTSDNVNKEIFSQYHSEYVDYFGQFEQAKGIVSTQLVPENLRGHDVTWEVDYAKSTLTLTINCDCEDI